MGIIINGNGIDMGNNPVSNVAINNNVDVVDKEYVDTKQSKSELTYNVNTSSYIPNTLSSGAVIERGSNANGEYIKFADGTLITYQIDVRGAITGTLLAGNIYYADVNAFSFPHAFKVGTIPRISYVVVESTGRMWLSGYSVPTNEVYRYTVLGVTSSLPSFYVSVIAIGIWK